MAVKTKTTNKKFEPRPQARLSLAESARRLHKNYGDTLAKLAK